MISHLIEEFFTYIVVKVAVVIKFPRICGTWSEDSNVLYVNFIKMKCIRTEEQFSLDILFVSSTTKLQAD